jgi:hypothetical protein
MEVKITADKMEQTIGWYERERPAQAATFRAGWEAFRSFLLNGSTTDQQLAAIVELVRGTVPTALDTGSDWLARISIDDARARQAVAELSTAKTADARFGALCCLSIRHPRPFLLELLIPAIDDKSSKVRWKAVEKALHLDLPEAIPAIERRQLVEGDAKVQGSIRTVLPLLRDGYEIRPAIGATDGIDLLVGGPGGIRSRYVSQDVLGHRGVAEIAKEWRDELLRDAIRCVYVP